MVVLTHKTQGSVAEQERAFRNLGVERIFAFENYTPMDNIKTRGRHEDVLRFLQEVIKDVQFRLSEPRNPENEMLQHKHIVFDYIRKREGEQRVRRQMEEERERQDPRQNRVRPEIVGQRRKHSVDVKMEEEIKSEDKRRNLEDQLRNIQGLLGKGNPENVYENETWDNQTSGKSKKGKKPKEGKDACSLQ
ncbi:Hypothetical predicted protein [Pelobates cultripes]|uniref:Uncharacterized protein n=1 Tax=Pelobates cultripes TaxID=61616 RepID=A0AAD1SWL8_PELCU|nr:Hypothetical predicted protein [Pelobates cultripes]